MLTPATASRVIVTLLAVVRLAAADPAPRYTGALPIREWSPEETGGKPQSYSVIQHPTTGLIYAGNEAGVLEYDGARWRMLPLPPGAPPDGQACRGLAFDDEGRLWVAADNDLLIFAPDASGNWRPQSLRAQQPSAQLLSEVVWEVRPQGGYMWAVTTGSIVRIDPRSLELRAWPQGGRAGILGEVDGSLWFHLGGHQFLCTRAGEPAAAPVPDLSDKVRALGVARTPAGVLQVEHSGGVMEWRDGTWVPLSAALEQALAGGASRVRRLADGRRIFSTRARTLVFADADGTVLGRIAEPPGVSFGVTPMTMVDRDGGLWMANATGIRRAQIDGAVTRHGPDQGLRGGARRMYFEGNALLVATAQGLFLRDAATGFFAYQPGSPSDMQALWPDPAGGWLAAAGRDFGEWREGAMVTAPGAPAMGLTLAGDPRDPRRVFVSQFNEIMVYRRDAAGWTREAVIKGPGVNLFSLGCDASGVLWLSSTFFPGLWRAVAPAGDWSKAVLERVDGRVKGGSPAAPWRVAVIGGGVILLNAGGIWHEEQPGGRLVPDERFAGLPKGAKTPLLCLREGRGDALYAAGAGEYRDRFWRGTRAQADAPWTFAELEVPELKGQVRLDELREAPDGRTLWLGGTEGAFSIDLAARPAVFDPPAARWRGVRALDQTTFLYGGAVRRDRVELPRAERSVALEFSAVALRTGTNARTGLEYRTRAAGLDRDWTAWSPAAARELTNLPPGDTLVEVQARNLLGVTGPVAGLVLAVPPFWWETWWARALAVLAGAGGVAAAVRGLVRRQFQQRIALLEAQAAVQQERLRIARDMHDDLGSTLASIVHLSEGAPPPEQAAPALARVHTAARDLVHRTRDIVWAATPQHDSLESLVEQMAAHAERTLGDRGIAVRVDLPAQLPEEAMPSAVRHDVFLAFKEAVNNAAKYSQARQATVRVTLQPAALLIELADDGVGFAPGEVRGTGHGLPNLRGRLAAIGGTAEITSAPGRGTTVTLRVPRTARKQ